MSFWNFNESRDHFISTAKSRGCTAAAWTARRIYAHFDLNCIPAGKVFAGDVCGRTHASTCVLVFAQCIQSARVRVHVCVIGLRPVGSLPRGFAGFNSLQCGSPRVLVSFCPCMTFTPPLLLPPPPICTHSIVHSHTFPPSFCVSVLLQNHPIHEHYNLFKRVCVCRLGECVSLRAAVVSHSKQMLRVKLRNASLVRRGDRQGALQDECDCLRRCLTLSVSLLLFLFRTHALTHFLYYCPCFWNSLAVTSALASQAATPRMFSG